MRVARDQPQPGPLRHDYVSEMSLCCFACVKCPLSSCALDGLCLRFRFDKNATKNGTSVISQTGFQRELAKCPRP